MNKKLFSGILAAFLIVAPFLANGATGESEDNYYLAPGLTINDNLYVAGSDVNISGTVTGDLFAAGGNVTVSGPVEEDLMAAGGSLNISGKVSGDERVAGGTVTISNVIGGDLLVAGGQVIILPGSTIGKDIEISGGNINYRGESNGKLSISGGDVYINGKVNGDLSITAQSIKIGPDAMINGNFEYSSPREAVLEQGAKVNGTVEFTKTTAFEKSSDTKPMMGFMTFALITKLSAIIFAALIFFYFFRKQTEVIIKEGVSNFWKNAGKGFVILIVVPAAVILSFITIIGAPLGVIGGILYVALLIVSSIIANLIFAQLCINVFKKGELNWWIIILSVIIFGMISFIPFIGWLFKFIILLVALSSLSNYTLNKLKN
ncbi:MAG: hypothetical protein WC386_01235 [Candidatus Paceibacterota bacterium]|jgi:cytoskeletal protein CcmA (bactofilin family)